MKTKEQILEWLDKQPWKGEFYENHFKYPAGDIDYNAGFIASAFVWSETGFIETWSDIEREYKKWYNSTDKPISLEEYCIQHPIILF